MSTKLNPQTTLPPSDPCHKHKGNKILINFVIISFISITLHTTIYAENSPTTAAPPTKTLQEDFFKAPNNKLTKYFVIQDSKDIDTDNSDYDVVSQMNSYYLMKSDKEHNFNPNKDLQWWTLFKAMLQLKQTPLVEMSEKEKSENEVWQDLKAIVNEKVHAKFLEQTTDILFTAKEYGLFEKTEDLLTPPSKEITYQMTEKLFNKNIKDKPNDKETPISRIEFARLFIKEYKIAISELSKVTDSMQKLVNNFEENVLPKPSPQKRISGSSFQNYNEPIESIHNARQKRLPNGTLKQNNIDYSFKKNKGKTHQQKSGHRIMRLSYFKNYDEIMTILNAREKKENDNFEPPFHTSPNK